VIGCSEAAGVAACTKHDELRKERDAMTPMTWSAHSRAPPRSDPRPRRGDPARRRARRRKRSRDVAYAIEPSPLGDLLVPRRSAGWSVSTTRTPASLETLLDRLAGRLSRAWSRRRRAGSRASRAGRVLAAHARSSIWPLDWSLTRVHATRAEGAARIPYGGASTYREMASRAEASGRRVLPATRSVPTRSRSSSVPRVLADRRRARGYGGGVERKRFCSSSRTPKTS